MRHQVETDPEFQKHIDIFSTTSLPTIADFGSLGWGGHEKDYQTKIKNLRKTTKIKKKRKSITSLINDFA